MENNTLHIRGKQALLQLINEQIDLIPEYFMDNHDDYEIYRKRLKKDKVFHEQAKWIDEFVEKNFKDIPIIKEKLYTKKEIIWNIIQKVLLFIFFALHAVILSVIYARSRTHIKGPFILDCLYICGPLAMLVSYIGIYLYVRYGIVITTIPLHEYFWFLCAVEKRIESIPAKKVRDMLKMYVQS
jgi:hypothetical protein